MAVVHGSLALVLEMNSRRTALMDRKTRPVPVEVLLSLFRKEPHHHISVATANIFESDKDNRITRVGVRGNANSRVNAGNFPGLSDDDSNENGNGKDEDEVEAIDWEEEVRKRVKEIQEMKELEKKAEEVQNRIGDADGEGNEVTEEEKRMRVKKELEKVAKEQAERRKMAQLMFKLGQKAYGKGMYGRAIEFLEGALTIIPRPTLFGGEIQIWLAMAYDAYDRHGDCIALYRQLETTHPSLSIRRQAADLRYISQAPKLKISQEEMVTIPYIGSIYDSYAGTWSDKYKDRDQKRFWSTTNQLPSTKDYLGDFLVWRPPTGLEKNQVFWVALTAWLGLVGAALFLQR